MEWTHWHVNVRDYKYPYAISIILLILSMPAFIPVYGIAIFHNQELGISEEEIMTGDNDYELSFHFNRHKDALRFMRLINAVGAVTYLSET